MLRPSLSLNFRQRTSLVHGDVISFIALDLILRITFSAVMHVTFVLHVVRVFLDDNAFNISGFGVPSDMVSNSELLHHSVPFKTRADQALGQGSHGPYVDAAVADLHLPAWIVDRRQSAHHFAARESEDAGMPRAADCTHP